MGMFMAVAGVLALLRWHKWTVCFLSLNTCLGSDPLLNKCRLRHGSIAIAIAVILKSQHRSVQCFNASVMHYGSFVKLLGDLFLEGVRNLETSCHYQDFGMSLQTIDQNALILHTAFVLLQRVASISQ